MSKTKRPVIGITLDYYLKDDEFARYSNYPWYCLRQGYSQAVSLAGGIPFFLPFEAYEKFEDIENLIDGILIPGGDQDVPPSFYNQQVLFENFRSADKRSAAEAKLIKGALKRNMPIFCICHGVQLLNVVFGGSLFQRVTIQKHNSINHQPGNIERSQSYHDIRITPGSKLAQIICAKDENYKVNSNHRQAIDRVGTNLLVSALCSEDQVIEAVESPSHDFVIGVQWHPEYQTTKGIDDRLFEAFISAAIKYRS